MGPLSCVTIRERRFIPDGDGDGDGDDEVEYMCDAPDAPFGIKFRFSARNEWKTRVALMAVPEGAALRCTQSRGGVPEPGRSAR
jgi:hypothetical protein